MKPKPVYDEAGITIYHGDCREIVPHLGRFDLLLTDPPYGIRLANNDRDGHRSNWRGIEGDDSQFLGEYALSWAHGQAIPAIAFASPWKPWSGDARNLIVWDKGGAVGGGGDTKTCLKRSWELIQVYRNGPLRLARDESVWRFPINPADCALHICAKPVPLLRALIAQFSGDCDLIVDPFCGIGSTLEAAKLEGRRAIGIELEKKYVDIAIDRLSQKVLAFE